MRLILAIITSLLIASASLFSQSLTVFDIDTTNFPTIKAKFYAFDAAGNQIKNLSPSDFEVIENSTMTRPVTNVTCPNSIPVAVSSVLVFDMSGSMSSGPPRIESAKKAANAWINGLPTGQSECALVSFDDQSMILHDFTKDRTILKNSIAQLQPRGGTNYNQALIDLPCGGLNIAKSGKNKRVLIFLTDGQPNFEPRTQEIINFANQNQITIYAVTLDMPAPQCIKDMTKQTGGQYFENITSQKEAEETYQKLLQLATSVEPCEISWQSGISCTAGTTNAVIKLIPQNLTQNASYQSPNISVAKLEFNPKYIKFQNPLIGTTVSQDITVTARNSTFVVTDIKSSDLLFDISPKSFTLAANESKTLTISYTAKDSVYTFAKFSLEAENRCNRDFYASARWIGKKPDVPTLKITNPNGGEMFAVGSDTVITWDGIPADELVKLEYSINNGNSWKSLDTARGLLFKWKNIPLPTSSQCVVKVKQLEDTTVANKLLWTTLALGKSVNWSSNGRVIATCAGNIITLLDAITLDTVRTIAGDDYSYIACVCFSPDGSKIASGTYASKTIRIWDITTGQLINTLTGHTDEITSVRFSPDGSKIASSSQDLTIKLWEVATGKLIKTFKGHYNNVLSVCFSPDGNKIVSGGGDNEIRIWNIASGQEIKELTDHKGDVNSVCFSPDGSKLASGSGDNTINVWDASTYQLIYNLEGHTYGVNNVCFSPDGRTIASGSMDSTIKLWDVSTGNLIYTFTGHVYEVNSVCFSPDGGTIASGSEDGTIKLWNVVTRQLINSRSGSTNLFYSVCFSPDGSTIASGTWDNTIKLWDTSTGGLINTLSGHTSYVSSVCFSPDGSTIASGSNDGTIKLWDAVSGQKIETITIDSNSACSSICFSPDGGKIVSSGEWNKDIKIWDTSTGELINTLTGHTGFVYSVNFSPDGRQIVSGSLNDKTIKIWDVVTGQVIKTITTNFGHSVCFSPDGRRIASDDLKDYTIKLWDTSTGELINTLTGHTKYVTSVNFSPDGRQIVSGSWDATVKLWEASTGQLIKTLTGNSCYIKSVCFSPDGCKIASGGWDATVKLWLVEHPFVQFDISDSLFAIVAPELKATDIDMKQCLVNGVKDSLVTNFIHNTGTFKCKVDSIYFTGTDKDAFSLVSGLPVYTVDAGKNKATEFRFKPKRVGIHTAQIVIITQADTLIQNIIGEGVQPMLKVVNNLIDFGKVNVGEPRDSIQAVTIKNVGTAPLTITSTKHNLPDDKSFSTITGGGNFTIPVGETHKMDLRFIPTNKGRTSGILEFHYNGPDSPAEILLYGEGLAPEIEIVNSEIDFGKILLGSDSTIHKAITIANTGTAKLKITDVKITNSEFERLSGLTAFDLLPDDTLKYDLKFTPSQVGSAFADLEIYHNQANSPTKVRMIGEGITPKIEVVKSEIDFGKVLLGSDSTIRKAITIANIGTGKLRITDVKITNSEFTRLSGLTAFDLLPDDTLKYDLKFTPSQVGPDFADLEIYHNQANSPTKVQMKGEGYEFTGTASATIQALNISANSGEIIELPIILKNQANLAAAKITSLKLDVSFNPTLLYPLDFPVQTIDQNTSKITIENLPINIAIGQPLTKIKFKAALGNAEDCNLILSNAEAIGGNATINPLNGTFTLLGVCHEGGTRLVNPNANIGIQSITPNPAKDKITISAKITEIGTKIKLINIAGKVIKEIDCPVDKNKAQEFTIDLTNIPAGMYFIEFKSPNFSQVEKVVVEK